MVNSIGNGSGMPPPPPPKGQASLSDENVSLIQSTLEGFDSENLSEEDMLSIVQTFSDAGIRPGKEMAELMGELGFDARKIGDAAKAARESSDSVASTGTLSPRMLLPEEEIKSLVEYIEERLEDRELSALSDEEKSSLITDVAEKFGLPDKENLLNIIV